ncbi:MAG TPA: response regulator [Opitutus sp.]|nr:response regulator [Opitutus sp.]
MPQLTAPTAPLRLLIVEDKALDAELMIEALELARVPLATTVRVESAPEFLQQLSASPDVILCDYALPAFSAPEALRLLQQRGLDIPFIIISGSIGEETAVEAVKSGADDYLLKDRLGRLGAAVVQAVEEKKLRAAAQRAEEDLRQSEYKYRCLFEHLPDAAYLCDSATGRIIDANPRGESLLGLDRTGVLGLRLSHFVPATLFRSLLAVGQGPADAPVRFESESEAADGQRLSVHVHASIVLIYNRRLLLTFFRTVQPS